MLFCIQVSNPMPLKDHAFHLPQWASKLLGTHNSSDLPSITGHKSRGKHHLPRFVPDKLMGRSSVSNISDTPLMVDGSIWLHAPKFLLWVLIEANVIAVTFYLHFHSKYWGGRFG